MKIGILQAGHAPGSMLPKTGDYADLFKNFLYGGAFKFSVYNVVDMEFPSSIHDAAGWLITGSRHGVYDRLPFIKKLEALVRDIHKHNLPLVGVCFGHQLIARALGGKVNKFHGGWAVGHTEYYMGGQKTTLNAWHQDQIVYVPEGATLIGSNQFCKYAFLKYGRKIFTIQAHPEFDNGFVEGLINTRGKGVVPTSLLEEASKKLSLRNDSELIRQDIIKLFLSAMV